MHGVDTLWSCCVDLLANISLHDPPYHKTMEKYEDFEEMVISLLSSAEILDSNMVL